MNKKQFLAMTLMIMGSVKAMESRLFLNTQSGNQKQYPFANTQLENQATYVVPLLEQNHAEACQMMNQLTEAQESIRAQIVEKQGEANTLRMQLKKFKKDILDQKIHNKQQATPEVLTLKTQIFLKALDGWEKMVKLQKEEQALQHELHANIQHQIKFSALRYQASLQGLRTGICALDRDDSGFDIAFNKLRVMVMKDMQAMAKEDRLCSINKQRDKQWEEIPMIRAVPMDLDNDDVQKSQAIETKDMVKQSNNIPGGSGIGKKKRQSARELMDLDNDNESFSFVSFHPKKQKIELDDEQQAD